MNDPADAGSIRWHGVIEAVAVESHTFTAVLSLHKRYKKWLGHLPDSAFEELAAQGTLLAAIGDEGIAGYVLYRLPDTSIAIVHLCVDETVRGGGIARALVDEVADRHPTRRGIRLRCRRDWPASEMWPRLDFEPRGDVPGRSIEGHLLTHWWRDFGHPDLFTYIDTGERPMVALDMNVFLDLVEDRPGANESRVLLADWVLDSFQPVITKQVTQEINNHPDKEIRARHWRRAETFARADAPTTDSRRAEAALRAASNPTANVHDDSDLRHVARAAAAGAGYFVTRDARLRRQLAPVSMTTLGIAVVSPAELVRHAFELREGTYEFAAIQGTRFQARPVTHQETDTIADYFIHHAGGERKSEFLSTLNPLLAQPDTWTCELVRDEADTPVALTAYRRDADGLRVALLRVTGPTASTVARQVAFRLRDGARKVGARWVHVSDPQMPRSVLTSLGREGFIGRSDAWSATTIDLMAPQRELRRAFRRPPRDFPHLAEWEEARRALAGPTLNRRAAADLEHRFWPMKIVDSELPTFLVPIRPTWAEALFDVGLNEESLFARPTDLGLSREHVYYRATRPRTSIAAPARIAWYVSAGPSAGAKAVRAVSQLAEVIIDSPKVLYHRFEHLGIYERADVESAASGGLAMALRFTDTELLEAPVPLRDLNRLARELDCPTPLVRSPWKMPPELFSAMYTRGRSR